MKHWQDWEKDYLFKHAAHTKDAELASHLGRSKTAVTEMRRKLGIKKNKQQIKPEEVTAMIKKHREVTENTPIASMDESQQRRHYINELMDSANWQECIQMFDEQELKVYQVKYVEFMMTLETVNEIEKSTIHIMIGAFIRMNRYQKLEKEYRDMAAGGDPELAAKAISLHKELRDTTEIYMKAEDTLNASRKQRIKEEGDQRLNLIELIKELDEVDAREKLGKEADALMHIQKLEDERLTDGGFIRGAE
jgi:hypothetical protein